MDNSYWTSRHTIRQYTRQPVSLDLINRMLLQASHAPTTGNIQLYSVIITHTDHDKQALAQAHFNQPQVTGCSVLLTFCADLNRYTRWCRQRNADPGFDNFQSLVAAILDTALVAQQFNTIAELNGLGCCILGTTTYNAPEIAQLLSLPPRVIPVTTITVGYPDETPADCGRLPLQAFTHDTKYKDYTPQDIDTLYAEKEKREDSRQFVRENGKQNLAQVFADIRYPRQANELFSRRYLDFIRQAGIEI